MYWHCHTSDLRLPNWLKLAILLADLPCDQGMYQPKFNLATQTEWGGCSALARRADVQHGRRAFRSAAALLVSRTALAPDGR